jgi:hypothetical protein
MSDYDADDAMGCHREERRDVAISLRTETGRSEIASSSYSSQ